jgi:phosphatidate phosphatase LPIN
VSRARNYYLRSLSERPVAGTISPQVGKFYLLLRVTRFVHPFEFCFVTGIVSISYNMQYVRSISGSVSKTWNSINPATLSGAIDVIVIEQEDGSLACSPFHVRFGKFSLLRPYEKKVEFKVNNIKQNYSMKLGEGGEAFFVFETTDQIPESLQTSPLVSPAASPPNVSTEQLTPTGLAEPTFLDITDSEKKRKPNGSPTVSVFPATEEPSSFDRAEPVTTYGSVPDSHTLNLTSSSYPNPRLPPPATLERSASEEVLSTALRDQLLDIESARYVNAPPSRPKDRRATSSSSDVPRPASPPSLRPKEALSRAMTLSRKLSSSNIRTQVTDSGDLMLDMTGYKSSEDDALRAEVIARKILSEELEGNYDIGSLIGTDEHGNLWIYSSEEAKEAANRRATSQELAPSTVLTSDAASDPGYHSDSDQSFSTMQPAKSHHRAQSEGDSAWPETSPISGEQSRNYAKTLRMTSDQLKELQLKPGANPMSFTVNRATCQAYMYYWSHEVPIVISDIDGTITKSDALGHVLNMIGRDWTHIGVAKLYTDIVTNGYNIFYLTSRSVGQADTTRAYLNGVVQDGYKLPKGPVIMSPDRTIAALRREIYLRKPEVFKMACLRDILSLFPGRTNPFYAGFGNRFTDALSYRTVNIPSTRIFTINSNAEVSLDLMSLNKYRSSYVSMRELVDHFFPPVSMLVKEGGENFTDFNYWRDTPQGLDDFSATDSGADDLDADEELEEDVNDLGESYISRESIDQSALEDSIRESIEIEGAIVDPEEDLVGDYLGEPTPSVDKKLSLVASNDSTDGIDPQRDERRQRKS